MLFHVYLILAMVIVGSSVPVGKVVASDMPVYLTLAARFMIGSLVLYGFMLLRGERIRVPLKVLCVSALLAMLGSVLFNYFLLAGLKTVSGVSSGILTGTLPSVLMVLSVLILREGVTLLQVFAVVTATCGAILASYSGGSLSAAFSGSMLVLMAVVCEACFLLVRKLIPLEVSSITLSFYVSLFGFIFFLFPGLSESAKGAYISSGGWVLTIYYGVFITAAAYILWFTGIRHVSGVYAAVYTAFMPLSAVSLSSLFLGEAVTLYHLTGFVLVSASMLALSFRR